MRPATWVYVTVVSVAPFALWILPESRMPLALSLLSFMSTRIPYAVANYEEIIAEKHHFVDKTRFIREI